MIKKKFKPETSFSEQNWKWLGIEKKPRELTFSTTKSLINHQKVALGITKEMEFSVQVIVTNHC